MVTGVVPFLPRFLPSIFIAHRVQQSHCSSIFHRGLLTHALALSASQFVRKKKSARTCTSTHSGGFGLTKPTYTRFEDRYPDTPPGRPSICLGGIGTNTVTMVGLDTMGGIISLMPRTHTQRRIRFIILYDGALLVSPACLTPDSTIANTLTLLFVFSSNYYVNRHSLGTVSRLWTIRLSHATLGLMSLGRGYVASLLCSFVLPLAAFSSRNIPSRLRSLRYR